MNIPGFTGEISLNIRSNIRYCEAIKSVDGRIADYVVPAFSEGECRRLLKYCISQPDPRDYTCDTWLLFC